MKEAKLHIKKEVWLIRILVIISFISTLFFFFYGQLQLFPTFNHVIISIKEKEAVQVGRHLTNMINESNTASEENSNITDFFKQKKLPEKIGEIISNARHDFGILKVKVFNAKGLTIYSTAPKDIGILNIMPYFQNQVAHGKTVTYLVNKDFPSLEGQTFSLAVVETYVPLMEEGIFFGAFEIYYNVGEEKYLLEQIIKQASLLAGSVSIFLLIVVVAIAFYTKRNMAIIRRADKTISAQAVSLQKKNDQLSILHDLSQVTNQALEIDAMLQSVLEIISDRLAFLEVEKRGIIFLCKGKKLEIKAHIGLSQEFIASNKDLQIEECFCCQSLQDGQVLISNYCKNNLHQIETSEAVPEHGHIIIPLKVAKKSLGVICLYTKPGIEISDHYRLLFDDIGSQIGGAVERATLFYEVKELSLRDALTGLPNRRLMESFLQQTQALSTRYGRNFSLIMTDIDHFKNYNDSRGHAAGDEVLQQVAFLLKKTMRESDLVARYGGEEFLIILPESEDDLARKVAEQIRLTVEQETEVKISCGYTTSKPGMQLETLIEKADQALYRAKNEGRNRVVGC
jgi:diguanylate cyclase (GGDEF)-like protein